MGKLSTTGIPLSRRRGLPPESSDEGGDHADCTGGSCRSCAALLIADCIAIGCCPCAVVSMLALVFVKVPWAMSRKCLRSLRRRWRPRLQKRVRSDARERDGEGLEFDVGTNYNGTRAGDEDERGGRRSVCCTTTFDAEKMWMELYQIGQWGFGRLSFSGNLKEPPVIAPAKFIN